MNNFRKDIGRGKRQTMDGILNAPSRPQLTGRQPVGRESRPEGLRTTPRAIGDFNRPQGYHAANSPVASPRRGQLMQQKEADIEKSSLLHMSLPPDTKNKEKKKKHGRDWKKIRKWSLRAGLIALALLIIVGGYLVIKGYIKAHRVFKGGGSAAALDADVKPSLLKGEGDGRINMLLLGRGGEGHEGADLTDTILLASIDPVNNKAALVSLPRDFWVTANGSSSKVNAVFAFAKQRAQSRGSNKQDAEAAGVKAVQGVMKEVLGVPIHYYAMVDFTAFKQAVDTVGGVDITITEQTAVKERLWDPTTRKNYMLDVAPGLQHFDGQRALFFARSRHTSPRGDFDRAERQRVFIQALAQKLTSAKTYTNPVKVSQLMDAFGDHIATDMSLNDAMRLMGIGRKIGGSFESIDLASPTKPLVKTGSVNGQSVVMPIMGMSDYSEIQALVRSKLKDGYIVKENATITVLNGTITPGRAGQKAEELRSYGYNIGTVADAPTQNYEKTVIVDLTKGKTPYTKNYLEKRLGVKATTKLSDTAMQPGTANYVIILGQDETTNN